MKEIIAICNQKGGVGKSTTANALGAGLHARGFKVLYIDMDAQGNLSHSLNALQRPLTTLEVLTETATAAEAICKTRQGDILPSSAALAGADIILKDTGREYRLKEALEPILEVYDYCLIDCPPALGILTINALTASDSVIIPSQADIYSLQGIGQLMQTIDTVQRYTNSKLAVKGLLITRYNGRSILTRDLSTALEKTAESLKTRLYKSKIRECIAIKEAQARQTDIFSYAPRSNAAADYAAFIEEVIGEQQ